MKITIEIPKEFESDYLLNKFVDFFNRIKADINTNSVICGNYEKETIEMFINAFAKSEENNLSWNTFPLTSPGISGRYLAVVHEWTDGNYLPKNDDIRVRIMRYQLSSEFAGWRYPVNIDQQAESDTHREVICWMEIPDYKKYLYERE